VRGYWGLHQDQWFHPLEWDYHHRFVLLLERGNRHQCPRPPGREKTQPCQIPAVKIGLHLIRLEWWEEAIHLHWNHQYSESESGEAGEFRGPERK
jgi:hypothetical protein